MKEITSVHPHLAMWGGIECTVNRVGEAYFDQLKFNGHEHRIDDLNLFAGLGIKTLRYPFVWERIAPNDLESADWAWASERLDRMKRLGIKPIAGLLHHGSGPRYTSLVDPEFPEKFAAYAKAFASRFPNVELYTPVNEPLTTARFSGLYGFWYPHGKDDATFLKALINQCKATVLAMQAIREINPDAKLVQTEDLGKTRSTPLLAYQAELENERRWLSLDLLCGKLTKDHSLWTYFLKHGITADELSWFEQNTCPPDIMGFNHYVTSNRYLDEHLYLYPEQYHGGNEFHKYADIEAVRVADVKPLRIDTLLAEAWERYHIPLAITEVHLDCTREEQMRWLNETWELCTQLKNTGVDVVAIAAWGLLGHYEWHCCLTKCEGYYEPGVYDLRGGRPRATGVAHLVKELALTGKSTHPVLEVPGWWAREIRVKLPEPRRPAFPGEPHSYGSVKSRSAHIRPLLITGATGTLGKAFAYLCELRAIPYRLVGRADMDITNTDEVAAVFETLKPWAVVNAAGYVRVDDAEVEAAKCFRENVAGAVNLAREAAKVGSSYLSFSSDLVFDGITDHPYFEGSTVSPLNVYGRSKALAETKIREVAPKALIVRTSAFFGPWDEANFVHVALERLKKAEEVIVPEDIQVSPTYVPDLVNACLDFLLDKVEGIIHLTNEGQVTWAEFAKRAANFANLDSSKIVSRPISELHLKARRPKYSVLKSERGKLMPDLDTALEHFFKDQELARHERGLL